ncbi:MAG: hypothetical protein ABI702_16470 [Burkholderiales bacterium]
MRHDPFGRSKLPAQLDRRERVALIQECAACLLRGEMPPTHCALFVAGALGAWLASESAHVGDLERHYLQTGQVSGSHRTAQWLAGTMRKKKEKKKA